MSRTYRNRERDIDRSYLNLLELIYSEMEKENSVLFSVEDGGFYRYNLNKKLKSFILKNDAETALEKAKKFIWQEIKIEQRYIKKLITDKSNWRGAAIRMTKEYSNMKSRSGKRNLVSTIMKNIDIHNVDDFNDVNYFEEPNLGSIKGAIWYFD